MKLFFNGALEQYKKDIIAQYQKEQEIELLKVQKKTKFKLQKAFECGGVVSYELLDINNLQTGRAMQAVDFYNELNMKCSRDFLKAHTTAFDNEVKGTEINITKLAQLNQNLKERLEMIIAPDIVYKIASVVYFDKSEEPYSYDEEYGRQKIARWKEHGLDSFFLLKPIKDLIPFLDMSEEDLALYTKVEGLMNQKHLKELFTMLSQKDAMTGWYKSLGLDSIQGEE